MVILARMGMERVVLMRRVGVGVGRRGGLLMVMATMPMTVAMAKATITPKGETHATTSTCPTQNPPPPPTNPQKTPNPRSENHDPNSHRNGGPSTSPSARTRKPNAGALARWPRCTRTHCGHYFDFKARKKTHRRLCRRLLGRPSGLGGLWRLWRSLDFLLPSFTFFLFFV